MMFSATLSTDIRPVCKKFMRDVRTCGRWRACRSAQTRLQHTHQHTNCGGAAAAQALCCTLRPALASL